MNLQIIVCIKAVILDAPGVRVTRGAENLRFNPFDRSALEAALQIKETAGGCVTAVCMGPPAAETVLREAIAMGADKGILISDPRLAGADTLATATTLAAALKKFPAFDVLVFGTRSADGDTGHVGPQTATMMDIPFVGGVRSFGFLDGKPVFERIMDGFLEKLEIDSPVSFSASPKDFRPRDIGLAGIDSAFGMSEIELWPFERLELDPSIVGEAGSPTRVIEMKPAAGRSRCELLSGTPEEQADRVIERLSKKGLLG